MSFPDTAAASFLAFDRRAHRERSATHDLARYLFRHTYETVRRAIELSATKYCPVNAMLSAGATEVHHRYVVRNTGEVPFEAEGEVRQAVSMIKKRGGHHERSIRAFCMDNDGVHVGEKLRNFRGILTGVPVPSSPAEQPVAAQ